MANSEDVIIQSPDAAIEYRRGYLLTKIGKAIKMTCEAGGWWIAVEVHDADLHEIGTKFSDNGFVVEILEPAEKLGPAIVPGSSPSRLRISWPVDRDAPHPQEVETIIDPISGAQVEVGHALGMDHEDRKPIPRSGE